LHFFGSRTKPKSQIADIIREAVAAEFENFVKSKNIEKERSKFQSNLIYIEEASEITGWALSTIRKKCHYGLMPYNKPAGTKRLIFKRDELLSIIESGKREMNSEMEYQEIHVQRPRKRKR
jgi:hypothetical protein